MLSFQLGDRETLEVLQNQAWLCGTYKRYYVCGNQLGYYIVLPNETQVVQLAGQVVYTRSPEDAGQLIDFLLVHPAKTTRTKHTPKAQMQSTTTTSPGPSTHSGKTRRTKTKSTLSKGG